MFDPISSLAGILLSLIFSYAPTARRWFNTLEPTGKRLMMLLYITPETLFVGFAIAENGALTSLPGSPYRAPVGTLPGRVLVDSVSQHVFLIDTLTVQGTSRVHTYAMAADGRLTVTDAPAVDTGLLFADGPNAWVATR